MTQAQADRPYTTRRSFLIGAPAFATLPTAALADFKPSIPKVPLDLTALSIEDLTTLWEGYWHAKEALLGIYNRPKADGVIADVISAEIDRMDILRTEVVEEVAQRTPDKDNAAYYCQVLLDEMDIEQPNRVFAIATAIANGLGAGLDTEPR